MGLKEDLVRQQSEMGSNIGIRIGMSGVLKKTTKKNPQGKTEKNTCNK
jgi:hypothetical protein